MKKKVIKAKEEAASLQQTAQQERQEAESLRKRLERAHINHSPPAPLTVLYKDASPTVKTPTSLVRIYLCNYSFILFYLYSYHQN